jgi:hypothetical protein
VTNYHYDVPSSQLSEREEIAVAVDKKVVKRSRKVRGEVVGKRKPGLFSVLLLGFVVVITASALTAREQDSKSTNLSQSWQQGLD